MPAVENVLVVGGGIAGAATAILLAERGVSVDLVEVKPDVGVHGSGITLQGNALRVLQRLGVWPLAQRHGYSFDTLGLRAPDAHGTLLAVLDDVRTGGPELPATMGMHRPTLARILLDRARETGAKVRFGTTYTALRQDDHGVVATMTDGATTRYDLVVAADGVRSPTRAALGIELHTAATGMGIWRAFAPRPAEVTRTDLYYGGPSYIAGYCPTGEDTLYAYIVEDAQDRSGLTPEQGLQVMRRLSMAYHGPWDAIRESLTDPSMVNYTHFANHVLPAPWHRGRVVLIGDAVHTCPPTLAQGGAQALEDAAVLAELLLAAEVLTEQVWDDLIARRHARATTVVQASMQLGAWLLAHERGDVPGLIARTTHLLCEPA
jgi:2-polyprenyl-6-methoxyphenol hydroxylase-like FAD-dependent oxidoreductase